MRPSGQYQSEPIAIVGMACRLARVEDVSALWHLLLNRGNTVGTAAANRLVAGEHDAVRPAEDGSGYGAYLDEIDQFDAEFFGISPREARMLDPQLRILLETAWEALEDAGIRLDQVAGRAGAVYVGQSTSNYWEAMTAEDRGDIYAMVGSEVRAALPGRISHFLDLRGPSMTVDTACSSSLAAVHMACQSIRTGEAEFAIAAGVNLALLPEEARAYTSADMLAGDGRCKFGSASADALSVPMGSGS